MTDRELLELAAKAAGVEGAWREIHGPELGQDKAGIGGVDAIRWDAYLWNPLAENGDALRLAVNLRMRIHHDGYYAFVEIPTGKKYCWTTSAMVESKDHYAAMRHAIVRAAAEIGRTMKDG